MLATLLLLYTILLLQVKAEKLHLPVRTLRKDVVSPIQKRSDQKLLSSLVDHIPSHIAPQVPIYELGFYRMITNISIGTPPQNFSVMLSLFLRDLFVLSCMSTEKEFENHNHYNSSLSSTHTSNETRVQIPFLNARGSGLTSQDHVILGGVVAKDQLFAEALTIHRGGDTDGIYFEGILGLGARDGNSTMGTENILTAMYRRGMLDENMFALTIPYNEGDVGELILGGMGEDVAEESVKWIPVSNKTFTIFDDVVRSSWQVAASAVTVGDGTLINSTISANATAWIDTELPFLGLPHEMVDSIHTLIHARQIGWAPVYSVPKGKRHTFPTLMFRLGEEDVTITGYDYTICDKRSCMSLLLAMARDDLIALGGAFLRGVHSVFDLEENRVGFSELGHME